MNIIFLTLLDFQSYSEHNIYCDLLRELIRQGHQVYCISPAEKRTGIETHWEENGHLLKLKIGNTQKTNLVEKGVSTLMLEPQFVSAIKQYFANIKFDLVLYSTPPITLAGAVKYIKKRDGAQTYLMLKDIFPQNAVDLGMMTTTGVKGLLYGYFRQKEKALYRLSDRIGCMSPANVAFLLQHNPEVTPAKVGICPNCIEVRDMGLTVQERAKMREKYAIPQDKKVFVYGGNLGKPQGIPFILDCLRKLADDPDAYFLIVGDGTEYGKLEQYIRESAPRNVKLIKRLPREDYDKMIAACDVGLIFLDHRFTIPNFPSRLLSYMQARLPVICATDPNTDIGAIAGENGFGWWCESNDPDRFAQLVRMVCTEDLEPCGDAAWDYLCKHYSVRKVCEQLTAVNKVAL